MGSLEVFVANATKVPNVETFGKTDPYITVEFQGKSQKTEVVKGELDPVFNQKLAFDLGTAPLKAGDELKVLLKDWEMVGRNRLLGQCTVSLKDFVKGAKSQKLSLELTDANQRPTTCVVNAQISYQAPPGAVSRARTVEVPQGDDDEEEDEDEDLDEEGEDATDAPGGKKKKKKKKRKRMSGRKLKGQLSDKPQDFQVRVKIVEARQLPGANISPVTRVTCYNQTKQTRIKKSTNSPFFNEVFFFNYYCSPAQLFDEIITFGVYNSRKLRSDSLIGSFKCDVGMIYEEPTHSFVNKWLLLSDPEDVMAGAKGYLKICAVVLGPGDEAPSFKPSTQDEEEDIESNLLRPAGVQLRPATFRLRLFRAEDIPRMDSDLMSGVKKIFGSEDKKELVDPYFLFSFAGQEVKSKIMYNNDHPEFNQEMKLGLRFPSMCERLKFQMFDWDRVTGEDAVATGYLDLRTVSTTGDNGFLPTFGPCYVNFYGSPREFSELPDEYEDLNLGKGEGVAYRGRVLVQLDTLLGDLPESPIDDILSEDVYKVQKFQRRRKFRLHCAFMNATMVSAIDAPVEFEVSIGNYGNKLDESVPPSSSTTQPTNAVFDGCFYYFLPWGDNKPCVVVDSHWEDVTFRLEALNLITHISDRLEANMQRVRTGLKANLPTPELAQLMISMLDQLVADVKKPLPKITEGHQVENELDRQLRYYRETELEHISKEATKLREVATDVSEALNEVEGYMASLKNLQIEPQNSIPDVIIWMIAGDKRIAYFRCPANHVLWASNPDLRGKYCGKLETIILKYPGNKAEKENRWEIPSLLRCKVWFGLDKHDMEWHKMQDEGELAVYAETYENQVSILGNWMNKGPTMTRPKWSDSTGKIELMRDHFEPPPGWRWDGEWYVSPELSMLYDVDAGHSTFLEDCYECQARMPAGAWGPASIPWADVKGDAVTARDEIELPDGWEWMEPWDIDLNRAVDEEGWEYTVEATLGGYGPVEKRYHMCRRRRWVRMRKVVKNVKLQAAELLFQDLIQKEAKEGWEYAPLFNMKFHHKERKMDLVRRRRWHRRMVADDPKAPCFFNIKSDEESEAERASLTAPRMFLTCTKKNKYQLRAYLYQARDLLAGDSNGLSDPFARIAFLGQSQVTEKLDKTLCPTWDQTLIFEQIEIHGEPKQIAQKPPEIVIEIFDHDTFGSAEFLGRTTAYPMVKLDPNDMRSPVLQWFPILKGGVDGGELLAAFELFLMNGKDLPFLPPKRGQLYLVPNGIRPIMQRTAIEVMCWGVRNMQKFQLASVTSPSVEIEVGGHVVQSKVIKNTNKNPNFDEPLLFFDVMLPKEELYMPPVNVRVRDNRPFGRKPMVGVHVLKSLEAYRCQPLAAEGEDANVDIPNMVGNGGSPGGDTVIDMPVDQQEKKSLIGQYSDLLDQNVSALSARAEQPRSPRGVPDDKGKFKLGLKLPQLNLGFKKGEEEDEELGADSLEDDIDWWSKYYASTGELDKCKMYLEQGFDKLQVFNCELEKAVPDFHEFDDFCNSFPLSRGKNIEEEDSSHVGEFKGTFKVYPLPGDPNAPMPLRALSNLPPSAPEDCVVRVYIVRAMDLQPNDPSGLADPYVHIKLGKHTASNKDEYAPNTLNPNFGRMFELKAKMPIEKDLIISIKDYDIIGTDDIIGQTTIDLENRFLTKFRATCGLPVTYCITGPNTWRDAQTPKVILEEFCQKKNLTGPIFSGTNTVKVGNRVFNLADFEQVKPTHAHLGPADERLALHVLNALPPLIGNPLVPEHVETRPMYNPLQPGIEQGKIVMWVDLFPESLGAPGPPVDVKARVPKNYELRVVIWNTKDVILEEESITGEKMSDIYVKSWIQGMDEVQETDVHYRSMDGEGNFNWRMRFPFQYLPAEECMVLKRKEHFWSLDETEQHMPALLVVQIWDNDKFSADDFLGTVELPLNKMPKPVKKSDKCTLEQLPDIEAGRSDVKTVSLFEQKRVRGFWPCFNDEKGERELTGKVEMEIELVTDKEAEEKPVGQGQEEPNQYPHLDAPKRPDTSFLWFTSPWKTLKHIIWRNYKWYFIIGIIVILLIIFVVLFVYAMPGNAVRKMFGS